MRKKVETKIKHRLWQARHMSGLEQKQVAFLLGQKTTDPLSRLERGLSIPTLQTALKLEIIYRLPIRVLFQGYYEQYRKEVEARIRTMKVQNSNGELIQSPEDYCAYAELLDGYSLSEEQLGRVRKHVTKLTRKMAYL